MDPTQRFSDRVEDYARYRPGYPDDLVTVLETTIDLKRSDVIADVGCGTGNLAEPLLRHGNVVVGVEPNREMREAGKRILSGRPGFRSVDGRAEATTLDDASVDVVVAGQAFHWFDVERTRSEFLRILRPGRRAALIWNDRRHDATPLMAGYEALVARYGTDYHRVDHQKLDPDRIRRFFGPAGCALVTLPYRQLLDRIGFRGRLLSSSYAPGPGAPGHEELVAGLERLFENEAEGGRVAFEYETKIYAGRLHEARTVPRRGQSPYSFSFL